MARSTGQIARERSYRNRHSPTHDGVLGDSDRIDREGVLGEKIFAQLFSIPESEIVRDHRVTYNFKLHDGTLVDVRASSTRDAMLIIDPKVLAKSKAQVFVLVQLNAEATKGKVKGWATRKMLASKEPRKISGRPGATKVHAMHPGELKDIEELLPRHVPQNLSLF